MWFAKIRCFFFFHLHKHHRDTHTTRLFKSKQFRNVISMVFVHIKSIKSTILLLIFSNCHKTPSKWMKIKYGGETVIKRIESVHIGNDLRHNIAFVESVSDICMPGWYYILAHNHRSTDGFCNRTMTLWQNEGKKTIWKKASNIDMHLWSNEFRMLKIDAAYQFEYSSHGSRTLDLVYKYMVIYFLSADFWKFQLFIAF